MNATSAAQPLGNTFEMPAWKLNVSHVAAALTAIIFLTAGIWKATHPFLFAQLVEQLLVPYQLSLPSAVLLALLETMAGVLVVVPRFRRWGGLLAALLLVVFMIYIGIHYSQLVGKECSCFPWVKRTVGPAFFVGDAAMLGLALLAAGFSHPVRHLRAGAMVLAGVALFNAAGYAFAATHQSGLKAPDSVTVDGKPYSLQHGRIFLFFFDPTCSHCQDAATHMATYHWKDDVALVAIPTNDPQWAASFLHDTKYKAQTSLDLKLLRNVFTFGDPPYGVALENGRQVSPVSHFDEPEPADTLRKLGYIE